MLYTECLHFYNERQSVYYLFCKSYRSAFIDSEDSEDNEVEDETPVIRDIVAKQYVYL